MKSKKWKENKGKTGQKENKNQHAGENDACHATGINKYLLANTKSKWTTKRAYSQNQREEEKEDYKHEGKF